MRKYDKPLSRGGGEFMAKLLNLEVENAQSVVDIIRNDVLEMMYPIGSIYMSVTNATPKDLFGFGEWEGWCSGRVPVGVYEYDTDFDAPDKYGGEKTHTLTLNEIPNHAHGFSVNIQHGDGETTSGESLTSGLQVSGRRRYQDVTDYRGGGAAHNNMPPYQVCYMWKRIS